MESRKSFSTQEKNLVCNYFSISASATYFRFLSNITMLYTCNLTNGILNKLILAESMQNVVLKQVQAGFVP